MNGMNRTPQAYEKGPGDLWEEDDPPPDEADKCPMCCDELPRGYKVCPACADLIARISGRNYERDRLVVFHSNPVFPTRAYDNADGAFTSTLYAALMEEKEAKL